MTATSDIELLNEAFDRALVRPLRSIGRFAEEEIIIPSGPDEGLPFCIDRHPISRLLFEAFDSGDWSRIFITGPNQDGKTLMGFVIIVLYLLFERCERVVLGVPTSPIAEDKWFGELLPVIEKTRYAKYLPTRGGGARGGMPETIWFTHGPALRVMTGGGDDQARAGFSSPNLVVTEVEGFDVVGSSSKEGTKFSQLEKRTFAFDDDESLTVGECTVSTEGGRTWTEYWNGTRSRIAIECQHCGEYVTPGREHFVGWQKAKSEIEAAELAAVHCPECGVAWSNEDRLAANRKAKLVHRGQSVLRDGTVDGEPPQTTTLGFRWDCVNSAVNRNRMKRVARQEWAAANMAEGEKADAAEKDLRQAHWVIPTKPPKSDVRIIAAIALQQQTLPDHGYGVVPEDTEFVTFGCDVGKHLLHWTAIAWRSGGTPHVFAYGFEEVPSGQLPEEVSIPIAVRQLREKVDKGWETKSGRRVFAALKLVDAGYFQWIVLGVLKEFNDESWRGSKGYGVDQRKSGEYKRDTGSKRLYAGEGYAFIELTTGDVLWEFDADQWKSFWHNRLASERGTPGSFTLYVPTTPHEHLRFVKHNLNEKQVEEPVPGGGIRRRFVNPTNLPNHLLDSSVLATVGGHIAGVRIIDPAAPVLAEAETAQGGGGTAAADENWLDSYRNRY